MNKTKQFWALFKFSTSRNPFIWVMPIAFSGNLWMPYLSGYARERSLSTILDNYQLVFVGFLAVVILAPEIFYAASMQTAMGNYSGTEFLLTRATDRRLVYRAQATLLYLVILLVPVALFCVSLKEPTLTTREYSKILQEECLAKLPGTTLTKDQHGVDKLTIPNGSMMIGSWNIWTALATAMAVQLLIAALYSLMYRRYIFYGIYALMLFGPLFVLRYSALAPDHLNTSEKLFLLMAPHQVAVWGLTIVIVMLVQPLCERRFARMEQ